jgi:membrane protease YdiL (CAAX protease family)
VSQTPPREQATAGLVEPVATFFAATALASALYQIGRGVPIVWDNLHVAIAVIFLVAPALASRCSHRPFDYEAAGLRFDPVGKSLAVVGGAIAVTWPFFFGGFVLLYGLACGTSAPAAVRWFLQQFIPGCASWRGWAGASFHLPAKVVVVALVQIAVIAVPEEFFFRGYLFERFTERWPSRRMLLGAPVGLPLLLSSALFALGHVLVDFNPQRLAVFVPGLVFGWMRARTGSIAAGVLFHALCNLFSEALHDSFL